MRICVFGLGYVGAVSAARLAADGHTVIGVDTNSDKVRAMTEGRAPVVEPGLSNLIRAQVDAGRLVATTDGRHAMAVSELALVCVGTPSRPNGSIDTSYLEHVAEELGLGLAAREAPLVVSVRSTSTPGTTRALTAIIEEASGKVAGVDFGVCFNPEFLREGSSLYDYDNPPRIVVGGTDPESIDTVVSLYSDLDAPVVRTDLEHAEMVKYLDNAWHALKVVFANEVARMSRTLGLDSRALMDAFVLDRKLNISEAYLRPGFAFGGSCLPKDLRALTHHLRRHDLHLAALGSILTSNADHLNWALQLVVDAQEKKVGLLGLSFKSDTDDLRESPSVALVEQLVGKGYDVRVFDPIVSLSELIGANREYLMHQIPHIASLIVDSIEELVEHAGVVVIGTGHEAFKSIRDLAGTDTTIVDLIGFLEDGTEGTNYVGIGW